MRKVHVALDDHSYDILIGEKITDMLQHFISGVGFSKQALIITDENVGAHYGEIVQNSLIKLGLAVEIFTVTAGEHAKSVVVAEAIYTKAIEMGLDRRSMIFALGGGVVGDLAGFIAATYLRGIPFVQIPTSLLAQVDSSVGGKVAVNHALGKNLIGAFYQPKAVLIDLSMLDTLPERELYTGLAEIIKYGIIYDTAFFSYLQEHVEEILRLDREAMVHIIARSCEIKADVVSQDEKENGLRIILNFGHTIAHAVESQTKYARYNHGEAVAIGMYGAALLSFYLGRITKKTLQDIVVLIERYRLPLKAEGCTVEGLYTILFRDKKVINGVIQWVLAESIGKVTVDKHVSPELVKRVLKEVLA